MNILLDFFFPITAISPTQAASTAFLKQACVVVKPKGGVTPGTITLCTTSAQIAALTDNTEAVQLLNAGLSRVYILPMNDLDLATALEGHESDFFTLLISSDFSDNEIDIAAEAEAIPAVAASKKIQDITYTAATPGEDGNDITIQYIHSAASGNEAIVSVTGDAITVDIDATATTAATIAAAIAADNDADSLVTCVVDSGDETDIQAVMVEAVELENGADEIAGTPATTGLDVGTFTGVVGVSSTDDAFLADQAAIENRAAFHTTGTNKAKNMMYAFGKLLSNSLSWLNQQYITMPFADDVATVGAANALFDDKISFVISDSEFGHRLALLACGGKAIVAPYIKRNLEIDLQSKALTYISGNQPGYTKVQAALIEDELDKVVKLYRDDKKWIEAGTVEVKLEQDNFIASGYINIREPKALWRIFGEIRQTL